MSIPVSNGIDFPTFTSQYQTNLVDSIEKARQQYENIKVRNEKLIKGRWDRFQHIVSTIERQPACKIFVFDYNEVYGISDILETLLRDHFSRPVRLIVKDTNDSDDGTLYDNDPASYRQEYYEYVVKFNVEK